MILDQKVSGITCMEFNAQKKGTLLEPYAIIMWNAMNEVQFNAEQEKYVVEVRDLVVKDLESLLELLNIAVLFDEKKLKRVQWEKLGDGYCSEISNSMIKIIQESLEGYQKVINDNKVHAFEQDVAYVANFLEIMPTPESFVIDEETGRISRASLAKAIKTVNKVTRDLKAITGKDLTVGILISKFRKGGIPCVNKYYREIYDVLDQFGFIPQETKRIHEQQGSVYYRENYIKSFVFRENKAK